MPVFLSSFSRLSLDSHASTASDHKMEDWYTGKTVKCVYCHHVVLSPTDFQPSSKLHRHVTRNRVLHITICSVLMTALNFRFQWHTAVELRNFLDRLVYKEESPEQSDLFRRRYGSSGALFLIGRRLYCPTCDVMVALFTLEATPLLLGSQLRIVLEFSKEYTETVDVNNVRFDRPIILAIGCVPPCQKEGER